MVSLFEAHVDGGLAWVRSQGCELLPSVDNNLITSTALILQVGGRMHKHRLWEGAVGGGLGHACVSTWLALHGVGNPHSCPAVQADARAHFPSSPPPPTRTHQDTCLRRNLHTPHSRCWRATRASRSAVTPCPKTLSSLWGAPLPLPLCGAWAATWRQRRARAGMLMCARRCSRWQTSQARAGSQAFVDEGKRQQHLLLLPY